MLSFVEIRTHSLVRSRQFYQQVFAWPLRKSGPGVFAAPIIDDTGLLIGGIIQVPQAVPRVVCPYLGVQDSHSYADRVAARGGTVLLKEDSAGPAGRFSLTIDPWGNHLAFMDAVQDISAFFAAVELAVDDLQDAESYYTEILGSGHGLLLIPAAESSTAGSLVHVRVEDLAAARRAAEALGGKVLPRADEQVIIVDPEGNRFALRADPPAHP